MSNFLFPENQLILWNYLQKYSQIDQYFYDCYQNPRQAKEKWFQNSVDAVYSSWAHKRINGIRTIEDLNKYAIGFMLEDAQAMIERFHYDRSRGFYPQNQNQNQNPMMREYEYRQKEYENLNEKKQPPKLGGVEQPKDEAIQDIQSLVEREKKEREREFQIISNNTNDNIIATIVPDTDSDPKKTSIRWGENTEHEHQHVNIYELKEKIDVLEKKIEEIILLLSKTITTDESNNKLNEESNDKSI